jgi:SAM-dependent methyltransferase
LLNARAKGFAPRGIELTRPCVNYANEQLGIPVVDTQLEETEIAPGSLNVVTMNHVFEHLPEPRRALEKVICLLKPGGMFCGMVPNFASACSEALGEEWFWLDPNFHYTHFTPQTLRPTLEAAGFMVERIYTATGDYSFDAVRKGCLSVDPKLSDEAYCKTEIKRYEEEGRGEEIRFFARKPAASTPVKPTNPPTSIVAKSESPLNRGAQALLGIGRWVRRQLPFVKNKD